MIKQLLHAGCGSPLNQPPREFAAYRETRLDCNRAIKPDIVASIVAMPMIEDGRFDAIFCSHTLEHLFAHEVAMALSEFQRVLKPGGSILLHVPDLQSIGGKLALDQADFVLYNGGLGAVTPLDMLYGHGGSIGAGNLFMGHKTGFTQGVMKTVLLAAGFDAIEIDRSVSFELKARAVKPEIIHEQEEENRNAGRGGVPESGGSGNGHREVPGRALRETGVPSATGG